MEIRQIDLEAAARAVMAASGDDGHPSPEELLSYHEGEGTDETHQRILRHLAACPRCTRTVLDMASFPDVEPVDETRRVTEDDLARHWRRFQDRLREDDAKDGALEDNVVVGPASWFHRLGSSLRFAQAAAAVLFVTTLGLTLALLSPRDPSRPRVNLPIVELVPDGTERDRGETVRLSASADGVVVVLALVETRSFASYEVTIQGETGDVRWTRSGVERSAAGVFVLEIPRTFLGSGRYRIDLAGLDAERRVELATYALEIDEE